MSRIRLRIEKNFESFGHFVYRNRLKTIMIMLIMIAGIFSQLPKIKIDTSTEGFLHEDDPAMLDYNAFREQFGRDEMVIIAVNPPEVFDIGFLRKLKAFHEDLEKNVPYIDDITSLVNARNTRGERDELIVEDLLENFFENEETLAVIKKRALANPIYRNLLISEDGKLTTVVIKTNSYSSVGDDADVLAGFEDESDSADKSRLSKGEFLTDAENSEMVLAVRKVMERYNGPDFPLYLAGSPVVTNDLKQSMMRDMRRFMAMAVLTISLFLYIAFRRISGVVLPILIVILTLFSTLGLMAMFGVALKLPTQILPSFLLAVCVGDSVHVLAIFYHRFQNSSNKKEAVVYALGHSGLAIVMTSLTTAAGLASFSTAEINPIASLGIFASIGVLLGLVYTIVLLPALVALTPLKVKDKPSAKTIHTFMDRISTSVANFSTSFPKSILTVSFIVIVISLIASTSIRFSHNPLTWMPESMSVRQATTLIDRELKGSIYLEVIIDTGKVNGFYETENLNRLDMLGRDLREINMGELFVGKTLSVNDILKEINQALNEDQKKYYVIPQNRELIAQEFLLFENSGSDDLEDVVDSQFTKSRFTLKAPWLDAIQYAEFIKEIEKRFKNAFGTDADITVTGMIPLFVRALRASMMSVARSYLIAGFVITIMMIIIIGNFKIGLLSMIPNLIPIVLAMGVMGVLDMPMDMFTMLIGAIAIGLVVDDTIHFMYNFRRYHHETGDVREAVRRTLFTTGRAMLVTSIVLSTGFFIFMFSTMNNIFNFGLLTGFTIVMALLADFIVTPALMAVIHKPRGHDA